MQVLNEIENLDTLQSLVFGFEEIEYIEDVGMTECYDIQVEDDESFCLGNGIISHNSAYGGISKCLGNRGIDYFCLKGKPLNVLDITPQKFGQNEELKTLYQVLTKNDYKIICIASDQDLDGHHICALLLTFIWKMLPQYTDKIGRLNTPVKVVMKNKKPIKWTYDINEQLTPKKGEEFKYLKGLGSLTKEIMTEVMRVDTLDKMIVKFNYDDLEILKQFMGSDSAPRKEYILNHDFNIASA